jgi:hypothetical protein
MRNLKYVLIAATAALWIGCTNSHGATTTQPEGTPKDRTPAAKTVCSKENAVDASNFRDVLANIASSIAAKTSVTVVDAKYIGFNGSVISNNVSKTSAAIIAKLNDGREIDYTILVEDSCMIGGFGGIQ